MTTISTAMRPARIGNANTGAAPLATLVTAGGAVRFANCKLWFYPPQFVWSRLQGLHRASLAARPDGRHLPAARARQAYTIGLEAALAQFWVASDGARMTLFDRLLDAVATSHSFDGLESAFLTGFNTASVLHDAARLKRAATAWHSYGAPAKLGGGAQHAVLLDTSTNSLSFLNASAVASLGPAGSHANLISAAVAHLAVQLPQAGLIDTGAAQDGDNTCKGIFKLAGAIVGGVLGAGAEGAPTGGAGAIPGWLQGAGLGATAGDIVGDMLCGGAGGTGGGAGGSGGAGGLDIGPTGTSEGNEGELGPVVDQGGTDTNGGQSGESGGQSGGESTVQSGGQSGGESTNQSGGQSGGESTNQSGGQSNENQSGGNQSGGDQSGGSGDGNGSGGNDTSGGMPNPDDPKGMPNPDDPRGFGAVSGTYPTGAGIGAYVSRTSSGAWMCHGVPQLGAKGTVAQAGLLAAVPSIAAQAGRSAAVLSGRVAAAGIVAAASHLTTAAQTTVAGSKTTVATPALGSALHE